MPVYSLVNRLIPEHTQDFIFEEIQAASGKDVFEIESRKGKIVIRGNNGVSMARGLNHYLKNYCHASTLWYGENLNLPEVLPIVQTSQKINCKTV